MVEGGESCFGTDFFDDPIDLRLVTVGHVDVLDRSALDADQVVVMASQPLGQFVSCQALGPVVRGQHSGVFQDREGAVDG